MSAEDKWKVRVEAATEDIEGFGIGYKDVDPLQRAITKVMFWTDYTQFISTNAPKVYFENEAYIRQHWPWKTLEHEWVHLKDADTFFGLLPFMPLWFNRKVFGAAYLFPQILGLGALGAIGAIFFPPLLACLGCLLFAAPWPAPFRAWAEVRAYRRSIELRPSMEEQKVEEYSKYFTGPDYYFMWPFKQGIRSWLTSGPSPYREEMDALD